MPVGPTQGEAPAADSEAALAYVVVERASLSERESLSEAPPPPQQQQQQQEQELQRSAAVLAGRAVLGRLSCQARLTASLSACAL